MLWLPLMERRLSQFDPTKDPTAIQTATSIMTELLSQPLDMQQIQNFMGNLVAKFAGRLNPDYTLMDMIITQSIVPKDNELVMKRANALGLSLLLKYPGK